MQITLYKVTADPRTLDKLSTATQIGSAITVKPTNLVNQKNPIFEIKYDDTYFTANYCYCDTFDRYYYINQPRVNTGNRIELPCFIDVRQSFKNSILKTPVTFLRLEETSPGEKIPTKFIDDKLPIYPNKKYITSIVLTETTQTFNTNASLSYMLTVVGGEPSV